jgi:hypothetical protein
MRAAVLTGEFACRGLTCCIRLASEDTVFASWLVNYIARKRGNLLAVVVSQLADGRCDPMWAQCGEKMKEM